MRLHEEYITRHSLDVPIVRYDKRSTVFLRSKDSPCDWRIFSTHWNECDWHPGHFVIRHSYPCHDGYLRHLLKDLSHDEVKWDKYEEHVLKFVENKGDFEPVPSEEKTIEVWKMFLYMYDSALSGVGSDLLSMIGKSVNPELDYSEKLRAISTATLQLRMNHCDIYDSLSHQVLPLENNYADWLVKLLDD